MKIVFIFVIGKLYKTVPEIPEIQQSFHKMSNTNQELYKITENELHYFIFRIQKLCSEKFEKYMAGVKNYLRKTATLPGTRQVKRVKRPIAREGQGAEPPGKLCGFLAKL